MNRRIRLGINIDHVATLRQARGTRYPDPVEAAFIAEAAGADGITVHLREDRRHIQDRDVRILRDTVQTGLNLEMAVTEEMLLFAEDIRPDDCCLVPERREELTTEGGLDVAGRIREVSDAVARLSKAGIRVAPFIDPDSHQVNAVANVGAPALELHTGAYAGATDPADAEAELERLRNAAEEAHDLGLKVHAGHGLHYHNVANVAALDPVAELNIGHAIVARAVMDGLAEAVARMRACIDEASA